MLNANTSDSESSTAKWISKGEPGTEHCLLNHMMICFCILFSSPFIAFWVTRLNFEEVHNYEHKLHNIFCSHTMINHPVETAKIATSTKRTLQINSALLLAAILWQLLWWTLLSAYTTCIRKVIFPIHFLSSYSFIYMMGWKKQV